LPFSSDIFLENNPAEAGFAARPVARRIAAKKMDLRIANLAVRTEHADGGPSMQACARFMVIKVCS
jgi:hypothetical protein